MNLYYPAGKREIQHWLETLANVLGPHTAIHLEIDTMREVILTVKERRADVMYEMRRSISWEEFENSKIDPLILHAESIIEEWDKIGEHNE